MTVKISVIIPLKSLSGYLISETLPALKQQTSKGFEVIVLPNNRSRHDAQLLKKYEWLRIVPTGKITRPAEKRDIGVKHAKGEIIAFIDDDAYPQKSWLKNAARLNERKDMMAVCGPGILPHNATAWEQVFDAVLTTWIGSGGYSYRFQRERTRYVDDYPSMNFLMRKDVFETLGGFDSNYWPGEDSKLCEDIVYKLKGKILYDPDVTVHHHRRPNLAHYLRQHGNYGFHRGAFFAHGDRNSRRLGYLAPTFFLLYLFSLIFALYLFELRITDYGLRISIFYLPLILYILGLLHLFIKSLTRIKNPIIAAGSVVILFLTHVIYGLQFLRGFFVGLVKKEKIYG